MIFLRHNPLPVLLKGLIVGSTMLVPGVSGGSMAMILNIYDPLLAAVSRFRSSPRTHLSLLVLFALGAGVGMLLFAGPLLGLISRFPKPSLYFFLGAILGAVPAVCGQSGFHPFTWRQAAWTIIGLTAAALIGCLPENLIRPQPGPFQPLLLAAAGFVSAAALILPGVSVSWFLMVLGLYEDLMRAIAAPDPVFLAPLAVGLLTGVFAVARSLDHTLQRHPRIARPVILGFVIGSALEIFPGSPEGIGWLVCIIATAAGFSAVYCLERFSGRTQSPRN